MNWIQLHSIEVFIGFNLIHWVSIYAVDVFWCVLFGKNVEKHGKIGRFSGRLWPDW